MERPSLSRRTSSSTVSTDGEGVYSRSTKERKRNFIVNSRLKRGGGHVRVNRSGRLGSVTMRPSALTRAHSQNPNSSLVNNSSAVSHLTKQRSLNDLHELNGPKHVAKNGLIPLTQRKPNCVWDDAPVDNDSTAGNLDSDSALPTPSVTTNEAADSSRASSPVTRVVAVHDNKKKIINSNISNAPPFNNTDVQASARPPAAGQDDSAADASTTKSSPVHNEVMAEPLPHSNNREVTQATNQPKWQIHSGSDIASEPPTLSRGNSLSLLANRKVPSTNVKKSQAELYDLGSSTSRTQQKLLIQRASSKFDIVEDDMDTNPSKRFSNPHTKHIMDLVRTQYRNILRNRELIPEFLEKIRSSYSNNQNFDSQNAFNTSAAGTAGTREETISNGQNGIVASAETSKKDDGVQSASLNASMSARSHARQRSIHVPKTRKDTDYESIHQKLLQLWSQG